MSRARAESSSESKWIGSILAEDDLDESPVEEKQPEIPLDRKEPVARSTSAPPQLSSQPGMSEMPIDENDPRLSPQYFAYYYSQRPLDPRLPPPLFNWTSWRYAARGRELELDFLKGAPSGGEERSFPTPDERHSGMKSASGDGDGGASDLQHRLASLSLNLDSPGRQASAGSSDPRWSDPPERGEPGKSRASDGFPAARSPVGALSSSSHPVPTGASPAPDAHSGALPPYFRNSSAIASPMMAVMGYGVAAHRPIAEIEPPAVSPATPAFQEYRSSYPQPQRPPAQSPSRSSLGNGAAPAASATVPPYWDQQPTYIREPAAVRVAAEAIGPRDKEPRARPAPERAGPASPLERRSSGRSRGARSPVKPRTSRSYDRPGSVSSSGDGISVSVPVFASASPLPRSRSGSDASRPAWLEEFRHNKNTSNISLRSVVSRGLLIELAVDQNGSRFIQTKLETASPEEKQAAFEQLLPEGLVLCTDVFGNYVIQKFLEFGTYEQKKLLAGKLVGNVKTLSLQMYGCRVIQKAIEVLDVDTQATLVRELEGHVMECVRDQNGNHVIQKCIEKVPPYLINFIVEAFMNQVYSLSTHPYGCRVIQRLLENCSESQRNSILTEVLDNVEDLCKNQYGNYVIQHVLVNGTAWHKAAIVRALRGKVFPLSKHKFASNVIEKCFAYGSDEDQHTLIEEILGKGREDPTGKSPLILMVKDQYANYVVQKILDIARDEQRNIIIARIKRHIPNLRKLPYGKHIIARIEKLSLLRPEGGAPAAPFPPSRAVAAAASSSVGAQSPSPA